MTTPPEDPRTPEGRSPDGTEALPVDADPTADATAAPEPTEWARGEQTPPAQAYPEHPTEYIDQTAYTSDANQAYGASQPTEAYPTQAYPAQGYPAQGYPVGDQATQAYPTHGAYQPGPNPTQEFPTYDGYQQGPNPTQSYPTAGPQNYGPPNYGPPGYGPPAGYGPPPAGYNTGQFPVGEPPQKKGPGRGVVIAAVTVAVLLLAAVIGLGALLLGSNSTSDDNSAAVPSATAPLTARPTNPLSPSDTETPGMPQLPGGLGDVLDTAGSTIGSIKSSDNSTLVVAGLNGSDVTVTTDSSTQVIAFNASTVGELKVGETVMVIGDRAADGTIAAHQIIVAGLPDFGDNGGR